MCELSSLDCFDIIFLVVVVVNCFILFHFFFFFEKLVNEFYSGEVNFKWCFVTFNNNNMIQLRLEKDCKCSTTTKKVKRKLVRLLWNCVIYEIAFIPCCCCCYLFILRFVVVDVAVFDEFSLNFIWRYTNTNYSLHIDYRDLYHKTHTPSHYTNHQTLSKKKKKHREKEYITFLYLDTTFDITKIWFFFRSKITNENPTKMIISYSTKFM